MLAAWERITALPEDRQREVIRQLNIAGARSGRHFVRHTFQEMDATASYLRAYGDLLDNDKLQRYVLDRYTDEERGILFALVNCKDDETRSRIYKKTRSELARTRRKILELVEPKPERKAKRKILGGIFG